MASSGYGFLWPRIVFDFDGDKLSITCRHSDSSDIEPIRYLSDFRETTTVKDFETAVDEFIDSVLARLDACGVTDSELQALWPEVLAERSDKQATAYRSLEACLGYEPDEAPEELVDRLRRLEIEAGAKALPEIAAVCSGDNASTILQQITDLAHSEGVYGRVVKSKEFDDVLRSSRFSEGTPWDRGYQLARAVREKYDISNACVSDEALSDLLAMEANNFQSTNIIHQLPGLAVRNSSLDTLKLHFSSRNRHGRRFECARFLSAALMTPQDCNWLLTTDMRTAHQKTQRAFAAEFLCPVDHLIGLLDGDYSDDAIDEVSGEFDVSPLTVRSQLINSGGILDHFRRSEILDQLSV